MGHLCVSLVFHNCGFANGFWFGPMDMALCIQLCVLADCCSAIRFVSIRFEKIPWVAAQPSGHGPLAMLSRGMQTLLCWVLLSEISGEKQDELSQTEFIRTGVALCSGPITGVSRVSWQTEKPLGAWHLQEPQGLMWCSRKKRCVMYVEGASGKYLRTPEIIAGTLYLSVI